MCRVLHLSESGYYRWLRNRGRHSSRQLLAGKVKKILEEHPDNRNYGVNRVRLALERDGVDVSRRTVYRVMKENGWLEMSRNVQSGTPQNLKSMVIQRSFPKWSVAERRKTAAASNQAAVCACAHSRYFTGGSPSGLRV